MIPIKELIQIRFPILKLRLKTKLDFELVFFSTYAFYLSILILKSSFYSQYLNGIVNKSIFLGVSGILALCVMMRDNISKKSSVLAVLSLAFTGVFVFRLSGRFELIPFPLLLFCGRNIRFERIARITAIVSSFTLAFVIISSYAGIIPNYVSKSLYNGTLRIRHYLGFRYALYPAGILFNIVSMDLYAHHSNITLKRCLAWLLCSLFVFFQTDSRLFSIFSVLVIFGFFLVASVSTKIFEMRIIQALMVCSFIICAAASFIMTFKFTNANPLMKKLNNLLEQRLRLGKEAFSNYDIKPFGQKIAFIGNGLDADGNTAAGRYNYVDNFYESILLKFGYLFLIAFLVLATIAAYRCCKKKDYYMLGLLTILAVHGMIDDMVLYLSYNSLWFVFYSILIPRNDPIDINALLRTITPRKRHIRITR